MSDDKRDGWIKIDGQWHKLVNEDRWRKLLEMFDCLLMRYHQSHWIN